MMQDSRHRVRRRDRETSKRKVVVEKNRMVLRKNRDALHSLHKNVCKARRRGLVIR